MHRPVAKLLPVLVMLLSGMALQGTAAQSQSMPASADTANEAFRAFLSCDASFFNLLKQTPAAFGPKVQIVPRGSAAAPAVSDPLSGKGRFQLFSTPVNLGNLSLLGWYDEVSYTPEGAVLFWGFQVAGQPGGVADAINERLFSTQRLIQQGGRWARSERRRIGEPAGAWHSGGVSGTIAPQDTTERILLLDTDPHAPSTSVIFCSLQGLLNENLLKALRPDLTAREYPR